MTTKRITTALVTLALAVTGVIWASKLPEPLPTVVRADLVVIEKSRRSLTLFRGGKEIRTYRVALGRNPIGNKQLAGDNRTPEGRYFIDGRNDRSAFHRSLHISYPSREDRSRARARGVDPGGAIMIHGIRNDLALLGRFHRLIDWTRGCIAVTNSEIDEIWQAVPNGTPVEIRK